MKKSTLISILTLFIAVNTFAQKPTSEIKIKPGQEVLIDIDSKMSVDMDMGMSLVNNSTAQIVLDVKSQTDTGYILHSSFKKFKMEMEQMGQNIVYDSEKPEDRSSEMGQALEPMLNNVDTMAMNKKSGNATSLKKNQAPAENSFMGDMMGGISGIQKNVSAFFIIPAGKKSGDSWTITDSADGLKTIRDFKLTRIEKDIATIEYTEKIAGTTEIDMQGMPLSMTMNGSSKGEIICSVSTGILQKKTSNTDMTGIMDVMGQTMNLTTKATSTNIISVK